MNQFGLDPTRANPAYTPPKVDDMEGARLAITNLESVQITVTAQATMVREKALAIARDVVTVQDDITQVQAVNALQEIALLKKTIEESRKAVKAPCLDLGKRIDDTAKSFLELVLQEEERIKGMLSMYQLSTTGVVTEVERNRQEELGSIDTRIVDIEVQLQNVRQSLEENLTKAKTAAQKNKIAKEASEMLNALEDQKLELMRERKKLEDPLKVAKPKGVSMGRDWEIQVTDIHALYAFNPRLVRMEPDLPKIKGLLKLGKKKIPGLEFKETTAIKVRTAWASDRL